MASITSSARTIRCGSAGAEPRRHGGIAGGKRLMQRLQPELVGLLPPIGPDLGRNVGNRRQTLGQRLEIEAGAADEDRQPPLPPRFDDGPGATSSSQRPTE